MFDLAKALEPLESKTFDHLVQLRLVALNLIRTHQRELPLDFQITDMIAMMRVSGWLHETQTELRIQRPLKARTLWDHLKESGTCGTP
jgi:hypothetical protein